MLCGTATRGRCFSGIASLHLGLLFILLLLVFEHDLLLIGVVARDALDFRVGWNLELVFVIAVKEFALLVQHILHRPTYIVIQLFY